MKKSPKLLLLFLIPIGLWIALYFIGIWQRDNVDWISGWPSTWWMFTDIFVGTLMLWSFGRVWFINFND